MQTPFFLGGHCVFLGFVVVVAVFGWVPIGPDLDLAAKTYTGGDGADAAARCANVVTTELMGIGNSLLEGEGGVCGAVYTKG